MIDIALASGQTTEPVLTVAQLFFHSLPQLQGELTMMSLAAFVITLSTLNAEPQLENAIEQIKVLEPLVGDWRWDVWTAPQDYVDLEIKKGDKFDRIRTYTLDLVNAILEGEVRLQNSAGKRVLVAKSISGWDAAAGKIVGMEFWAGPFGTWYAGRLEWSANGKTLRVRATGSKDKDQSATELEVAFEGRDVAIIKTVSDTLNGQPTGDDETVRLERIK